MNDTFFFQNKEIIIIPAENFSKKELQNRLKIMGIDFNLNENSKKYYDNKYNEAVKNNENKLKIIDKLITDTNFLKLKKTEKRKKDDIINPQMNQFKNEDNKLPFFKKNNYIYEKFTENNKNSDKDKYDVPSCMINDLEYFEGQNIIESNNKEFNSIEKKQDNNPNYIINKESNFDPNAFPIDNYNNNYSPINYNEFPSIGQNNNLNYNNYNPNIFLNNKEINQNKNYINYNNFDDGNHINSNLPYYNQNNIPQKNEHQIINPYTNKEFFIQNNQFQDKNMLNTQNQVTEKNKKQSDIFVDPFQYLQPVSENNQYISNNQIHQKPISYPSLDTNFPKNNEKKYNQTPFNYNKIPNPNNNTNNIHSNNNNTNNLQKQYNYSNNNINKNYLNYPKFEDNKNKFQNNKDINTSKPFPNNQNKQIYSHNQFPKNTNNFNQISDNNNNQNEKTYPFNNSNPNNSPNYKENLNLIYSFLAGLLSMFVIGIVIWIIMKSKQKVPYTERFFLKILLKYLFWIIKQLAWKYIYYTLPFVLFNLLFSYIKKIYKRGTKLRNIFNDIKNRLYEISNSNQTNGMLGLTETEIINSYSIRNNISFNEFNRYYMPKLKAMRKKNSNIKEREEIVNGYKQIIWYWSN